MFGPSQAYSARRRAADTRRTQSGGDKEVSLLSDNHLQYDADAQNRV